MPDSDSTKQVLALRQRLDEYKTSRTEAGARVKACEEQLAAADDAITRLELDPDRDLERQVTRLVEGVDGDLTKMEEALDEVQSVLGDR